MRWMGVVTALLLLSCSESNNNPDMIAGPTFPCYQGGVEVVRTCGPIGASSCVIECGIDGGPGQTMCGNSSQLSKPGTCTNTGTEAIPFYQCRCN